MAIKRLKQNKSQHLLLLLASFLHKHTPKVLLVFLALTAFFTFFALRLKQKTTIRDLLPSDNPVVHNFEETVKNFDLVDRVVVVLQFEAGNLELAQTFAEIFVEQAELQEDFPQYLHWLKANLFQQTEDTDWYRYLSYITRVMVPSQIEALAQRLSREGIEARIRENRRELESGVTSKILIEKDPLNLLEFAGSYTSEITGNYQISFTDGFLVSKDQTMLLILGKPIETPENVDFSIALDNFLQARIAETKLLFDEEEEIDPDSLFEIGLTGPHPISAHENKVIQGDVVNMFVTSFAMVLLLFVLAYRRPLGLLYVGIPLFCAEVWTLGIGYFLFGRLNLLTATFSAVIVGLGIDYAIHIFSRYLDERSVGLSPERSMQIALSQTGLGTIVGGFTTALAFLAMGISNFSGVREFAIIASIGILLCLLQMFVLLPCMLFWRESWRRDKTRPQRAQWDFQVEKLLTGCLRYRKLILTLIGLATVLLAFEAIRLRFNTDIRGVRARSNPSIKLQNEVTEKVGGSLRSMSFVLEGETEEDLYRLHQCLVPVLRELKESGSLVRFDSLLMVLRPPERQRQNIEYLAGTGIEGKALIADFTRAMDQYQLRITPGNQRYIEHLAAGLDTHNPVTLKSILNSSSQFIRPFLNFFDGKYRAILHVYPSKGLWEKDATKSVTDRLLNAVPEDQRGDIFVTGIQTIADELKILVRGSFKYSTTVAIFLVIATLFFHFRKFSLVFLTLIPLLVGVVWMLGTMKLLGVDITLLNFVATPIIIGIGIDDGVHIVEKYLHRGSRDMGELMATCGKAVTLTSLTTIFGFSSLFLADYSGFQSLGLCAILGVFFCWIGSVVLLPLLMETFPINFMRSEIQGPEA